jgi:hypothetical protein
MQLERPPVPTLAGLRTHLDSLNEELTKLLRVARHPRTQMILTAARIDLRTAEWRLDAHPDSIERENLDIWLELVNARLDLVSDATTRAGAYAVPQADVNSCHARGL